jgi:hypothetical protein
MLLKKIIGVHGFIGVNKNNSFVNQVFQNFEPCLCDLKAFSSTNLNMGIKTTQNFTLISKPLRKM